MKDDFLSTLIHKINECLEKVKASTISVKDEEQNSFRGAVKILLEKCENRKAHYSLEKNLWETISKSTDFDIVIEYMDLLLSSY